MWQKLTWCISWWHHDWDLYSKLRIKYISRSVQKNDCLLFVDTIVFGLANDWRFKWTRGSLRSTRGGLTSTLSHLPFTDQTKVQSAVILFYSICWNSPINRLNIFRVCKFSNFVVLIDATANNESFSRATFHLWKRKVLRNVISKTLIMLIQTIFVNQ